MHSRDVLAALRADGWEQVAQKGSRVHLKHAVKAARVTVAQPHRDLPIGTLRSNERQAHDCWKNAIRTIYSPKSELFDTILSWAEINPAVWTQSRENDLECNSHMGTSVPWYNRKAIC
jgi:predicted RNA binding protein YcfA (HicA-like mRNA interferase family)